MEKSPEGILKVTIKSKPRRKEENQRQLIITTSTLYSKG